LRADALDFLGDAANHGLALAVVGLALHWRAKAALLKGSVMGIKASKEDLQILHADPGGERGDRVGPSYPAFVADSPLEGAGFELIGPGDSDNGFARTLRPDTIRVRDQAPEARPTTARAEITSPGSQNRIRPAGRAGRARCVAIR